jgi:hypothetical protein
MLPIVKIQNGCLIQADRENFFFPIQKFQNDNFSKKKNVVFIFTHNTTFIQPFFSKFSKWMIKQNGEFICKIFEMF